MTETPTVERETPEPLDELAAALAAFQAEMPTVAKGQTAKVKTRDGGDYTYTYADLADVTRAAAPILARHGLAFVCLPGPAGLVGMLVHTSGQRLTAVLPINGSTPQQIGSSLTYMRRYLLGCMTGIVTDDDDDGRQAEGAPPTPQKRAPARPRAEGRPPVAPPLPQRQRPPQAADARPPIATEENPAPDGSVDVPLPEPETDASARARKAMQANLAEILPSGMSREDRLAAVAAIIGRTIGSTNDMSRTEVFRVLGFAEQVKAGVAGIVRRDGVWRAVAYQEPPDERG